MLTLPYNVIVFLVLLYCPERALMLSVIFLLPVFRLIVPDMLSINIISGLSYSWYPVFARSLNGSPFLSVPTNDAPDILNWFVTMSVIFIAEMGVHKICLVNSEPATKAATITRPQPVKKNCHSRFNRLCLENIIKLRLSLFTTAV